MLRIGDTLLEGSIDLVFEEQKDTWIIVDYKTDDVSGDAHVRRLEQYTLQCSLYALAITELTGGTVPEAVLAFLETGVEHTVKITPERLEQARRAVEQWRRPAPPGSQLALF